MALTVDKADVLLVAAELSTVTDAQWASIWADVELEVGVAGAGSQVRADRLAVQLAAHMATVRHVRSGGAASPGPLTSVSMGGVSKSYAQPAGGVRNSALESTKYGQEYVRLTRLFGRRILVT
jgi:hypothetical protein